MLFWKLKKNCICSRLRNFGPQQERNTSFQKRERVFFVYGNSYFTLPERNGIRHRGRTTLHHPTSLKWYHKTCTTINCGYHITCCNKKNILQQCSNFWKWGALQQWCSFVSSPLQLHGHLRCIGAYPDPALETCLLAPVSQRRDWRLLQRITQNRQIWCLKALKPPFYKHCWREDLFINAPTLKH